MSSTGVDIGLVRAGAARMRGKASGNEGVLARLTARLDAADRRGPDREQFLCAWVEGHAAALRRVCIGLRDAAASAYEHVSRQEWASRG